MTGEAIKTFESQELFHNLFFPTRDEPFKILIYNLTNYTFINDNLLYNWFGSFRFEL